MPEELLDEGSHSLNGRRHFNLEW